MPYIYNCIILGWRIRTQTQVILNKWISNELAGCWYLSLDSFQCCWFYLHFIWYYFWNILSDGFMFDWMVCLCIFPTRMCDGNLLMTNVFDQTHKKVKKKENKQKKRIKLGWLACCCECGWAWKGNRFGYKTIVVLRRHRRLRQTSHLHANTTK